MLRHLRRIAHDGGQEVVLIYLWEWQSGSSSTDLGGDRYGLVRELFLDLVDEDVRDDVVLVWEDLSAW